MKCNKHHGVFHLLVLHTTTEVMWEIPEDDSEEFRWSARPWVALRAGGPNGSDEKPEIAHDLPTSGRGGERLLSRKIHVAVQGPVKIGGKRKAGIEDQSNPTARKHPNI